MSNVIDLAQWRSEREQRRISPLLRQAERMRETARVLLFHAAMLEQEASGTIDYDMMAPEKIENLRALHNA